MRSLRPVNRISRKQVARAALLPLTATLLAACGSSGSDGSAGKGNDAVTIVLPGPPVSLDPCNSRQSAESPIVKFNVIQPLTQINPDSGKVDPLLATSWTQPDPHTWEFTLRTGVKFSDGEDFNAAAAAASINRLFVEKLACVNAVSFAGVTVKATAVDDTTLRITTDNPDPVMPTRLSFVDISTPKTPNDEKTQKPVGTGPYQLASYVEGQKLELVRNDNYWGDKPQVSAATYLFRDSGTVRASMVKTGEADISMSISPQDATTDGTTKAFPLNEVMSLRPNPSAPLDNLNVRLAIAYAINRDSIAKNLLKEIGKPTNQLVTEINNGYIKDYKGISYDPDKAKSLIAQAKSEGAPVNNVIEILENVNEFPGSNDVIAAVADNLKAVGLNVKVKPLESSAWSAKLYKPFPPTDPAQLFMCDTGQSSGDAAFTLPTWMSGDGKGSGVNDSETTKLFAQAFSASGDERARLYQQAAAAGYAVGAAIPYAELSDLMTLGKRVDYTPNSQTNVTPQLADIRLK